MRILKDNEIVRADLDDNTNGDDFEDGSDKEEEDSEKSVGVDDPSDDFNTEGKCQNIVSELRQNV